MPIGNDSTSILQNLQAYPLDSFKVHWPFFSWICKRNAYHFIKTGKKKRGGKKNPPSPYKQTGPEVTYEKEQKQPYPNGVSDLLGKYVSLEAPAIHHRSYSFATVWMTDITLGLTPLNKQSFLCFQISQATKMITVLSPFFLEFWSMPLTLP